jgi:competence protein ComEA
VIPWLERHRSTILTALAAAVIVGLVVLILQHRSGPQPLEIRLDEPPADGQPVEVYVAGAVQQPGVYTLDDGDRVADALEAAGGPAADADLAALNLARRLRDEDQITVPRQGPPAAGVLDATTVAKIYINTATAQLLDSLPGIGEVYSQRIVESRTVNGPFASIDDLLERDIIPRSTFDKIKDLITVGP